MPRAVFPFLLALLLLPARGWCTTEEGPVDYLRRANENVHRFVLDSGMVCLVREDRSAPVAAVQIWVGSGSIHEEEFLGAGLSHYMEHMIFKGTPSRGPAEVSRSISDAGGDINAYTSYDRTVFHSTLPSAQWQTGLDVLADALMHASLPADEWEREMEVVVREMAMGRDDPDRVISKLLYETAYRVHPYRIPIIGYEEVLRTMDRDDLAAYFHRHYVPDNMICVVVGDVDAAQVESRIRDVFAGFERRARAPVVIPTEPPQLSPRTARQTGPYQVSRLHLAFHTTALSHPDTPALDVLAAVVGNGRSSRLVSELKEKRKLVIQIDAWSHTPKDPGLFGVSATFEPAMEESVLQAIETAIASWAEEPFTEEEIEKARRQIMISELSALRTMDGQAYNYASGEFYTGDPFFSETYLDAVNRVTARDLNRVAAQYLVIPNRTTVILSPDTPKGAAETAPEAPRLAAEVRKVTLSNGIPVIVRPDHRLPFVNVAVALRGGLLTETAENNGITRLMSDLLSRGTETRTSAAIALTVESLGGGLSCFSGWNSFGLQAQCLSEDVETFMDLAADCLLHSTFPQAEVEKQRAILLAAIRQRQEQPMQLASDSLRASLFPDHPYRFHEDGTQESVSALSAQDLREHLDRLVGTDNLVLSIFGDIEVDAATALAEKYFGGLSSPCREGERPAPASPTLPATETRVEPKEQTILLLGFPGVDVHDPRADAVDVLRETLSGLSSDLAIEVRDKRGLVYYVGASQRTGLQPGFFALYAGTHAEALEEVRGLMEKEIQRIRQEGLRPEELRRAQAQIVAAHEMSLQDNGGLAQTCALNELYGLGYDHAFRTGERVLALDGETVRAAARSILDPGRIAVSIVRPPQAEGSDDDH